MPVYWSYHRVTAAVGFGQTWRRSAASFASVELRGDTAGLQSYWVVAPDGRLWTVGDAAPSVDLPGATEWVAPAALPWSADSKLPVFAPPERLPRMGDRMSVVIGERRLHGVVSGWNLHAAGVEFSASVTVLELGCAQFQRFQRPLAGRGAAWALLLAGGTRAQLAEAVCELAGVAVSAVDRGGLASVAAVELKPFVGRWLALLASVVLPGASWQAVDDAAGPADVGVVLGLPAGFGVDRVVDWESFDFSPFTEPVGGAVAYEDAAGVLSAVAWRTESGVEEDPALGADLTAGWPERALEGSAADAAAVLDAGRGDSWQASVIRQGDAVIRLSDVLRVWPVGWPEPRVTRVEELIVSLDDSAQVGIKARLVPAGQYGGWVYG